MFSSNSDLASSYFSSLIGPNHIKWNKKSHRREEVVLGAGLPPVHVPALDPEVQADQICRLPLIIRDLAHGHPPRDPEHHVPVAVVVAEVAEVILERLPGHVPEAGQNQPNRIDPGQGEC